MSADVLLPEFDAWKAGYRHAESTPDRTETNTTASVESFMMRARSLLIQAPARRTSALHTVYNSGKLYRAKPVIEEAKREYNGLELTLSSLSHDPTAEKIGLKPHHLPADRSPATAERFAVYAGGDHESGELVFVVDNSTRFGRPAILDHEGNQVQDDPQFNALVDRTLDLFESDSFVAAEPTD